MKNCEHISFQNCNVARIDGNGGIRFGFNPELGDACLVVSAGGARRYLKERGTRNLWGYNFFTRGMGAFSNVTADAPVVTDEAPAAEPCKTIPAPPSFEVIEEEDVVIPAPPKVPAIPAVLEGRVVRRRRVDAAAA